VSYTGIAVGALGAMYEASDRDPDAGWAWVVVGAAVVGGDVGGVRVVGGEVGGGVVVGAGREVGAAVGLGGSGGDVDDVAGGAGTTVGEPVPDSEAVVVGDAC